MKYSVLKIVVLICTIVTLVYCAPIDDKITTTTLSPTSPQVLTSENEKLADDISVPEENKEAVIELSDNDGMSSGDGEISLSETTARVVLEEDIAFFMPATTISTIISSEKTTTTTTSNANINANSTATNIAEEEQPAITTVTATAATISTSTTKRSLKPIIVNELSNLQFFTSGKPFVLICEAQNPDGVGENIPIKYSWNKNGRPFDELNDPSNNIYSESSNNGNILFVAPKSPDDEGTYQCVAENQFGKRYSRGAVVMERRTAAVPTQIFNSNINPLEGAPIVAVVPETVPDLGLNRIPKSVFYVYPTSQEETDVEVINMVPVPEIDQDIPVKGDGAPIIETDTDDDSNDELSTDPVNIELANDVLEELGIGTDTNEELSSPTESDDQE